MGLPSMSRQIAFSYSGQAAIIDANPVTMGMPALYWMPKSCAVFTRLPNSARALGLLPQGPPPQSTTVAP